MADEKVEEIVKPEALPAKSETELLAAKPVKPLPVKKLDPVDELGATIDHFLDGILTLFKKKTDAVIEKLDVPPKKQD